MNIRYRKQIAHHKNTNPVRACVVNPEKILSRSLIIQNLVALCHTVRAYVVRK